MADMIFTDDNFVTQVLEASLQKPVLVDFFATWCGPCKAQEPIVEEVAKEMKDKAVVGKIDVDDNANIAQQYEVMGIPSLKIFRQKKVVEEFTGLQQKQTLVDALSRHL